jgi:3-oxoacyl-[acyl-carrier protein] reductase
MGNLSNKVVLVTGASQGIGADIAIQSAKSGAKAIVNYIDGKKADADKTVEQIRANGGEALALQGDVSKTADVKKLFDQGIAKYGKIDILVNNAGIMIAKPIKDITDEEFYRQIDVNLKGTFNTMREAATRLADNGSIINMSSTVTLVLMPNYGIYGASKGGIEQLTRVFSQEVGRGINVNAILPGPTRTPLFVGGKLQAIIDGFGCQNAFQRLAEPEDVAKIAVLLASDDANWMSGQIIGVNGGMA